MTELLIKFVEQDNSDKLQQIFMDIWNEDSMFIDWIKIATHFQNNPSSNGNISNLFGYMCSHGLGVEKDEVEATNFYKKAADDGNMFALFNLGSEVEEKESFVLYEKSAHKGCFLAMNTLGDCYFNGTGVGQDYRKAFELYVKAANGDLSRAYANIGMCYAYGHGIERDAEKAIEIFKKTIKKKKSHAHSSHYLACLYRKEKNLGIKEKKIFELYLDAARHGILSSMNEVGKCYDDGFGVEKNTEKAIKWRLRSGIDDGLCDIKGLSEYTRNLLKKYKKQKQKVEELQLRPPQLGGPSYQSAKKTFYQ